MILKCDLLIILNKEKDPENQRILAFPRLLITLILIIIIKELFN